MEEYEVFRQIDALLGIDIGGELPLDPLNTEVTHSAKRHRIFPVRLPLLAIAVPARHPLRYVHEQLSPPIVPARQSFGGSS
jgi:hypothetical protein